MLVENLIALIEERRPSCRIKVRENAHGPAAVPSIAGHHQPGPLGSTPAGFVERIAFT